MTGTVFGYLVAGAVGFFIGVVLTTILLCKKNLEAYKQIESKVSNNVGNSINTAKAIYHSSVAAYENGEDPYSYDDSSGDDTSGGETFNEQ